MIQIAVCDDSQYWIGAISTMLEELQEKYHEEVEIEEYSSGTELLADYQAGQPPIHAEEIEEGTHEAERHLEQSGNSLCDAGS